MWDNRRKLEAIRETLRVMERLENIMKLLGFKKVRVFDEDLRI